MSRRTVARWETRSGKHYVELYRDAWGYGYTDVNAGGNMGPLTSDEAAIAALLPRLADFAPDAHKTPMKRTV